MNISVAIDNIAAYDADAIVVNLFEGVTVPGGATGAADSAMNGQIRHVISGGDFTGKFKQVAVLYPQDGMTARRVILVGLGKSEDFTLDRVRQVSAVAAKRAQSLGSGHLASIIHGAGVGGWTRARPPRPSSKAPFWALIDSHRTRAETTRIPVNSKVSR